jgi:hypothetical protein
MEDPRRLPHEKETGWHVAGGDTHFTMTSFNRPVFSKLLGRPEFVIERLTVIDVTGQELTFDNPIDVARDSNLSVIGVVGQYPVGGVSIGVPRNSNSHADIVKPY